MKLISIFSVLFLGLALAQSQTANRETLWKEVLDAEKKGLPKTAAAKLQTIYDSAIQDGKFAEGIKALAKKITHEGTIQGNKPAEKITRLQDELEKVPDQAKPLLETILAHWYWQYFQQNRYRFIQRTETDEPLGKDFTTWDLPRIYREIDLHFSNALADGRLKTIETSKFGDLLRKPTLPENYRPTLYDFIAHEALGFYTSGEFAAARPEDAFEINVEDPILSTLGKFLRWKPQTTDKESPLRKAVQLFQDILSFHRDDTNSAARVDADITRLLFAKNSTVGEGKIDRFIETIREIAEKEPSQLSAWARFHWANALYEKGEWLEARRIAIIGRDQFRNSRGGKRCHNLVTQIEAKNINVKTESVWSNSNAELSVVYRNITEAHFRLVKANWLFQRAKRFRIEGNQENRRKILQKVPVKKWKYNLRPTADFKQRTQFYPVPNNVPPGFYYLISSTKADFSENDNLIQYTPIWISELSLVLRSRANHIEGFVMESNSGEPVDGAKISIWLGNQRDKATELKSISDKNGFFTFKKYQREYYGDVLAQHGKKQIGTTSNNGFWGGQLSKPKLEQSIIFFTDRAIYRPSQTIQFKGIALLWNHEKDEYSVIKNKKITVALRDPNGQEVEKIDLKTNGFGSLSGSLTSPKNRLTGKYSIYSKGFPRGSSGFRIEEYKRPKFLVELGKPKQSPKLGDTVELQGKATDYTGSPIGEATGKFSVTRQARWPAWWRWHYWRGGQIYSQQRQVAHGKIETKPDGSFVIKFTAIPDNNIPEATEPTFVYIINADITDSSGETRSDNTQLQIGYTSLSATMNTESWQTTDKPVEFKITTQSLSGTPKAAKGKLTIHFLKQPGKVIRKRLIPFSTNSEKNNVINENPDSWPLGEVASSLELTTDEKGQAIAKTKLEVGVYRATFETKDRFGKPVKAIQSITVLNTQAKHLAIRVPQIVSSEKRKIEPGEIFRMIWGTGYDKGRTFIELEHRNKIIKRYWTPPGLTQHLFEMPVEEKQRGGFTVHVTQVRENRLISSSQRIDVPWTNKDLKIKWTRLVSKLRPGQKETWTATVTGPTAEKVVAEMVATLYDASLEAFAKHYWKKKFSIFRQDYSNANISFNNHARGLNTLLGNWQRTRISNGNYRYWAFPRELTKPPFMFARNRSWYGGIGGGGKFAGESMPRMAANTSMEMAADSLSMVPQSSALGLSQKMKSLGGAAVAGGIAAEASNSKNNSPTHSDVPIAIRKNLNETAFFFPHAISNEEGEVNLTFTMPEALTEWKLMAFAHDAETRSGFIDGKTVTSLDLMVRPNPPRFLREGDVLEFTTRVLNSGKTDRTGIVKLSLKNANTEELVNKLLGNKSPEISFTIPAGESRSFSWRLTVPDRAPTLLYQVTASADDQADGEENYLPVLSRRILVTESLPLPIRNKGTKKFQFEKLLTANKSNTLEHQSLTVQVASNPAWYAVLALPYLMEYPHNCAEQQFNRLYANLLASHIANSDTKIRRVFDLWKGTDALDSPLEKNEELKNLLLLETPWVSEAKNESQARRNVGILFDNNRLNTEVNRLFDQLNKSQNPDGGWSWMPGGRSNDYITLYITTGFGRLRHLGVKNVNTNLAIKALTRLDNWIQKRYNQIEKRKQLDTNNLSTTVSLYLYCRSFYLKDKPIAAGNKKAFDYFVKQGKKYWLKLRNRQSKAHIAIALHRLADKQTPGDIVKSILEYSVTNEELGMYWRDTEYSWWWYRAPIETQAMMIEMFNEISDNKEAVRECQIWLIKQKQTQAWKTTKATADAVYSILLGGDNLLASTKLVDVSLGGSKVKPENVEAGTGFYEQKFNPSEIKPELGSVEMTKHDSGVAWGSLHWQYLEDMSKVTPHTATPLRLSKEIYIRENEKIGKVLKPINRDLKPGDELLVRLILRTDRDMEFVHLKDQRGSGTEPINVLSRYKYQDGLAYYESTRDASSHFFIDYLPKGNYVFEYPVKIFHRGRYQSGIANIQSMYAPEFNSHSASYWLDVK